MAKYHSLETDRLILRRPKAEDVPAMLTYRNDPEVARYQGWGASYSEEQARELIEGQQSLEPGTPGEWFQFAVEMRETGALVGDCAIRVSSGLWNAEVGGTVAGPFQGHGIAIEAAARLIDFAFAELRVHRVVAVLDWRNARAMAVLARLGLRREAHFVESFETSEGWSDEYLYAILDREWRARRASENRVGP